MTGVIPRRPYGVWLSRVFGAVWCLLAPGARNAVRDNLRHMLGREPMLGEILAVFDNGALNYWDTFAVPHFTAERVLAEVDVHGAEHLARAAEGGHGVIVCTAHLASVSFVGQVMPALGYRITGVLEAIQPPELADFFAGLRSALGARMLPLSPTAVREMILALRRNEVLGLVTDRDVTGSGACVTFFDGQVTFPDGAASLALRSGAPILIGVCTRKAGGRFDAWFSALPEVPLTGDRRQDVVTLTQAIARGLEYHIASHPEQWTVFQKRWPVGPRP